MKIYQQLKEELENWQAILDETLKNLEKNRDWLKDQIDRSKGK